MRRWHAAVLAACIAGALVTPLGGRAMSQACAASAVHIAIVVDTGSGSSVSAVCVPAGGGENGTTLLAARASILGTPQPRYAASGLLCSIDGFPATGCGEGNSGYWSYWHGSNGAWTYANVGPASTRVDPAVVEGWSWQPGASQAPPRVAAVASTICKPAPPPTAATTAPVTTRTTVEAASPGPPTGAGPGSVGPVTTAPASRVGAAPPATTSGSRQRTTGTTGTTNPRARTGTSSTARPGARAPASGSSSTTVALASGGIATAAHTSDSGGIPIGLILGGVLVVALFTVGALAARRRRSTA